MSNPQHHASLSDGPAVKDNLAVVCPEDNLNMHTEYMVDYMQWMAAKYPVFGYAWSEEKELLAQKHGEFMLAWAEADYCDLRHSSEDAAVTITVHGGQPLKSSWTPVELQEIDAAFAVAEQRCDELIDAAICRNMVMENPELHAKQTRKYLARAGHQVFKDMWQELRTKMGRPYTALKKCRSMRGLCVGFMDCRHDLIKYRNFAERYHSTAD
jgi:hypothetical protein